MNLGTFLKKTVPWYVLAAAEVIGLMLIFGSSFLELQYEKPAGEILAQSSEIEGNQQRAAIYYMSLAAYLAARDSTSAEQAYATAERIMAGESGDSGLAESTERLSSFRLIAFFTGSILLLIARMAELADRERQRGSIRSPAASG